MNKKSTTSEQGKAIEKAIPLKKDDGVEKRDFTMKNPPPPPPKTKD